MSKQQIIQEKEYLFPYHYIPKWGESFSQVIQMRWGYEYASYTQFLVEKIVKLNWKSMLDVGCGDGRLIYEVSKLAGVKSLCGIDYFEPAVDFARIMSKHVSWACGDIRDQKILGRKFDLITLVEVLEHIEPGEVECFLQGIHHYLGDDGFFLVSVPHKNLGLQRKHYQHFDLSSLESIISGLFTIDDVFYLNIKLSNFKRNILRLFSNKHYTVTNEFIVNKLYNYYYHNMLVASHDDCRRIGVICRKKVIL